MSFKGIFAAVVTPFNADGSMDFDGLNHVLDHLRNEGCTGVLLSGTTGEGPSLSVDERLALFREAKANHPKLTLLAGTGAASLPDADALTSGAIEAGCDAALVLPPFFYMSVSEDGLASFYASILDRIDPNGPGVLLYHNPKMAPPLSVELVNRLLDDYPDTIVGIKDSSGDMTYTRQIVELMNARAVLVGKDNLLSEALDAGASGAITACTNVHAPFMVRILRAHQQRDGNLNAYQHTVNQSFTHLTSFPAAPAMKALLVEQGLLKTDTVRAPLRTLSAEEKARLFGGYLHEG